MWLMLEPSAGVVQANTHVEIERMRLISLDSEVSRRTPVSSGTRRGFRSNGSAIPFASLVYLASSDVSITTACALESWF